MTVLEPLPAPDWARRLVAAGSSASGRRLAARLATAASRPDGRRSAVLICLAEDPADPQPGVDVLLIQRSASLRNHPGQVAFPGGTTDPTDVDVVATAVREAQEETALDPSSVQVLGQLPDLDLTVTGFRVAPVLAWWREPHPVTVLDPAEVARVQRVPIAELVDPANRFTVVHPSGRVGPGFAAGGLFVWGFTAFLMDAVLDLAGWARPWDPALTRPVPHALAGPGDGARPPGDR